MKVSKKQMAENRSSILNEAARLFREKGFDAVSVAEIMKAAGLTHGGFYGHFKSKEDLIAHAIDHATGASPVSDDVSAWIDGYLSASHRDHPELGCPVAAMCGLMQDRALEPRAAMAKKISAQIDSLMEAMPGSNSAERRRSAIGSFSAMAGAIILARSIDDPDMSELVLAETRAWIEEQLQPPQPTP